MRRCTGPAGAARSGLLYQTGILATMSTVAVSIGGSIMSPESADLAFIRRLGALLLRKSRRHRMILVVGGGAPARRYIELCRALGADETFLDEVGIRATRLNASVLLAAVRERAYPRVAEELDEAVFAHHRFPIVVMGGTHPGHTTDAVTVFAAERARADRTVITTNVAGVYTSDPMMDPGARLLRRLTAARLVDIVGAMSHEAGSRGVIDPLGARLIARSRIITYVLDGRDLRALDAAIDGRRFKGSVVEP